MNINQPVNLNQTTSMHEPTPLNKPFNPNCFINSELSKNTLYSSIHAKGGLIESVSHRKASGQSKAAYSNSSRKGRAATSHQIQPGVY